MIIFLNPLHALIPKIPFSFFAEFRVRATSGARGSVSVGFWGARQLSPLGGGGGASQGALSTPHPPQLKARPPQCPVGFLFTGRTPLELAQPQGATSDMGVVLRVPTCGLPPRAPACGLPHTNIKSEPRPDPLPRAAQRNPLSLSQRTPPIWTLTHSRCGIIPTCATDVHSMPNGNVMILTNGTMQEWQLPERARSVQAKPWLRFECVCITPMPFLKAPPSETSEPCDNGSAKGKADGPAQNGPSNAAEPPEAGVGHRAVPADPQGNRVCSDCW